jgi:hypothetical protein
MAAGGPQPSSVRPVEPVYLIELFPGLHQELMRLLRGLDEADWSRPTACALWSVKDIVAHLLDTGLRRLSSGRDGFMPPPEGGVASYTDLVAYLNRLNAEWVAATRRLSHPVLLALMDVMAPQVHASRWTSSCVPCPTRIARYPRGRAFSSPSGERRVGIGRSAASPRAGASSPDGMITPPRG